MNNTPILTIVIPCYNAEKYLERCLSCLESLACDEVSLLFVNDGSTDSTEEIIKMWVECHKNARLIVKENGGYSTAINAGLDNCTTDYVMFMGVDDEIVPAPLHEICKHLRNNEPDMLAFSTEKVYDEGKIRNEIDVATQYRNPGYYEMDIFELCKKHNEDIRILFMRDTSRCYKMATIGQHRYLGKTGVSADGCFSAGVALRSKSFEFVNELCYIWHLHSDSVSSQSRPLHKLIEELDVWNNHFLNIKEIILHKRIPEPIINHYFAYRRLVNKMYELNEASIADFHNKYLIELSRWLIDNTTLSFRARFKLFCPKIYEFILKIIK